MSCDMWFGTMDYSRFIPTPQRGANVSPAAWGENGTLLNGSGYALNSYNSHKEYTFSWGSTAARENAQLMKSYFEGSFGRGKLYFQDPLTYTTNVLPARWADPSITANFEGPQLVPGVDPSTSVTSGFATNQLPVRSAVFNLNTSPVSPTLTENNAVFLPIPDGMQLNLGAFYSSTSGTAGVYVTPATVGGTPTGTNTRLTLTATNATNLFPDVVTKQPGQIGVWLWIGKTAVGSASVTVAAIHARLSPVGKTPGGVPQWLGGQGNSGVRFAGPPTYINNTGVNGGQVEFAATFVESIL